MPGWLKAILIIVGACVLAIAAMIFVAVRYFNAHRGELMEAATAERDAGRRLGNGNPPAVCIDAGIQRTRIADDIGANVRTHVFVDSCLRAANASPEFCSSVPNGLIDKVRWAAVECRRRGLTGNQGCTQVMNAWSAFCERR